LREVWGAAGGVDIRVSDQIFEERGKAIVSGF
jgi:hypothetical protein